MKLLATLFTAAAAVAMLPAEAATYDLGVISDEVKNVSPLPLVVTGPFTDMVSFSFDADGWAAFEVRDNATTLLPGVTLDITGLTVELWWDVPGPDPDMLVLGPVVGDVVKDAGFVSAGESYYLKISGTGAGTLPNFLDGGPAGQYSAAVAHAAAIPEPETWAMMLAGVGLIGLVGLRRNSHPSAD